jgi:hypothetical protein
MKKVVVLILCILSLVGCAAAQKKDTFPKNEAVLEPSAMVKFADVPVPSGFKLLPLDSYTFESSGIRVAVLRYQGKASPDQVVNFYKEQMAMYNWNLLNAVEYGQRLLNFDREGESCIVNLIPKGNNITITVSLGPKSQVYRKTSKEPVK